VNLLRTLKKLILGETWTLPAGVATAVLVSALVIRPLMGDTWRHAGGFVLLAGVAGALLLSVSLSAGRRRR
jgi:hypothetical protein